MILTARKIFMIIIMSQVAILLAYVVFRNLNMILVARQLTPRGELYMSPQNVTQEGMYSFVYPENITNSSGVSSTSHVTESAPRTHNVKPTTLAPSVRSGGGVTIRNTTAKGPTTPRVSLFTKAKGPTTPRVSLFTKAKGPTMPRASLSQNTTKRTPLESSKIKGPFQQIDDQEAWMYSAHFDYVTAQQGRPTVRIFGIVQRSLLKTVYCNLSISGGNVINASRVIELPDSHGVKFPPSYIECPLPTNTRPTHVSISFQRNGTSTNRFQIIYPGTRSRNFTVCYSVLHSGYNAASQLIQSIEMNRILGAEHFMVYKNSISPSVDEILQRYEQDGLVTVLPWPVPTRQTWYYGQMTALNDCFYRNRNISRFIVVVDTDELIIPHNHSSWMEVIHETSPKEYDVSAFLHSPAPREKKLVKTGCFIVMSSYYTTKSFTNWASFESQFPFSEEEKKNTLKYKIFTLSQLLRDPQIFPPKLRSKYIARPELTYTSGIHFVREFITFMRCTVVSSNISLVHHYRRSTVKNGIVDTSTLRFKNQLYPRVMEKYKLFPKIFP